MGSMPFPEKGQMTFICSIYHGKRSLLPHLIMHKGETFVDVGANVGYYSLKIAKEYSSKGVTIIAIEAHPGNYKALGKNIELNDFKCIVAINKAVSDHKGIVTLYDRVDTKNRIRSEMYSLSNAFLHESNVALPEGGSLEIESDTLDNILREQRVDVLKVDIEGAEVSALEGATHTLKKLRKIIVEVHGANFAKVMQILDDTHNFRCETIETRLMKYIVGSKFPN